MGNGDKAAPEFEEREGVAEETRQETTEEANPPAGDSEDQAAARPAKVGARAEEALKEFREEFDRDEPQ